MAYSRSEVENRIRPIVLKHADIYTRWEAGGRYFPPKSVRRDAIKKAYDITAAWLESGDTKDGARKKKDS